MSLIVTPQEMAERILSELEEAGRDNPVAMLNTVIKPTGYAAELSLLQDALRLMVVRGEVDYPFPRATGELPLDAIGNLALTVHFDGQSERWAYVNRDLSQVRDLALTKIGLSRAHQLLGDRGYRWWLQR